MMLDSQGKNMSEDENWSLVIRPTSSWWNLQLIDVWNYRDLLWLFVHRDFVASYKQTILGPLWFFIQPLMTTLMFAIVFSGIAKITTNELPPILFYLAGMTPWNYFSSCLIGTSTIFISYSNLFGKVYFPRIIAPLSIIISNLIQFVIQFILFATIAAMYSLGGIAIKPNLLYAVALTPILVLTMALYSLGLGIAISSLTTKYRDLTRLLAFGVQLLMYATPIIYPLSAVPEKYRFYIQLNPMASVVEVFRSIYLGGPINVHSIAYSAFIAFLIAVMGIVLFCRVEKTFMDTV